MMDAEKAKTATVDNLMKELGYKITAYAWEKISFAAHSGKCATNFTPGMSREESISPLANMYIMWTQEQIDDVVLLLRLLGYKAYYGDKEDLIFISWSPYENQ